MTIGRSEAGGYLEAKDSQIKVNRIRDAAGFGPLLLSRKGHRYLTSYYQAVENGSITRIRTTKPGLSGPHSTPTMVAGPSTKYGTLRDSNWLEVLRPTWAFEPTFP